MISKASKLPWIHSKFLCHPYVVISEMIFLLCLNPIIVLNSHYLGLFSPYQITQKTATAARGPLHCFRQRYRLLPLSFVKGDTASSIKGLREKVPTVIIQSSPDENRCRSNDGRGYWIGGTPTGRDAGLRTNSHLDSPGKSQKMVPRGQSPALQDNPRANPGTTHRHYRAYQKVPRRWASSAPRGEFLCQSRYQSYYYTKRIHPAALHCLRMNRRNLSMKMRHLR